MSFDIKTVPQILVGGWSDKVFMGVILGYLKKVSSERCYEYIQKNKDLLIPDSQREKYQRMAKKIGIKNITDEGVLSVIQEHRPDLADIIINHPQGMDWFKRQVQLVFRS